MRSHVHGPFDLIGQLLSRLVQCVLGVLLLRWLQRSHRCDFSLQLSNLLVFLVIQFLDVFDSPYQLLFFIFKDHNLHSLRSTGILDIHNHALQVFDCIVRNLDNCIVATCLFVQVLKLLLAEFDSHVKLLHVAICRSLIDQLFEHHHLVR